MMPGEDITGGPEPEAGKALFTPEPPALPDDPTHFSKIAAAVRALQAKGKWPPNMRPSQAFRLVISQLIADGHEDDLPERDTVRRARKRLGC
jgi:hypothetical protein